MNNILKLLECKEMNLDLTNEYYDRFKKQLTVLSPLALSLAVSPTTIPNKGYTGSVD